MKPIMLIGILLIVLGVVALAYQGITYTSREKIIDIGPIHATQETKKTIPLPPILGGVALAGGIVLVIIGAKNRSWQPRLKKGGDTYFIIESFVFGNRGLADWITKVCDWNYLH